MALELQIPTISQSNDATTLIVTDTTGVYDATSNPGGWGSPNPEYTDIDGTTYQLLLGITFTDVYEVETEYEDVDVSGTFSDWENNNTYYVTSDLLIPDGSSTPIGESTDTLEDGFYTIVLKYVVTSSTSDTSDDAYFLAVGESKIKVYTLLADVPFINDFKRFSNDFKDWEDITYPLYYFALLNGLEIDSDVSKKTQLLTGLKALINLLHGKVL